MRIIKRKIYFYSEILILYWNEIFHKGAITVVYLLYTTLFLYILIYKAHSATQAEIYRYGPMFNFQGRRQPDRCLYIGAFTVPITTHMRQRSKLNFDI